MDLSDIPKDTNIHFSFYCPKTEKELKVWVHNATCVAESYNQDLGGTEIEIQFVCDRVEYSKE